MLRGMIIVSVLALSVAQSPYSSPAYSAEKWKMCRHPGSTFTCGTGPCSHILASFSTQEECVAAKNSGKLRSTEAKRLEKSAKPAGAAALAACHKQYGKSVTSAQIGTDGKTISCYGISDDPIVMRDACKKRFGPMSQIRWHRGKWYCTA